MNPDGDGCSKSPSVRQDGRRVEIVRDSQEAIAHLSGAGDYGDRKRHPVPEVVLIQRDKEFSEGSRFLKWLRAQAPATLRDLPVLIVDGHEYQAGIYPRP